MEKISEIQKISNNIIDTIVITHCDIITIKNLLLAFSIHGVKMRVLNVRKVKYNINYKGKSLTKSTEIVKSREFYKLPELNKVIFDSNDDILQKLITESNKEKKEEKFQTKLETTKGEKLTEIGEKKVVKEKMNWIILEENKNKIFVIIFH